MSSSKYYNLESPGPGWETEEFARTVLLLEALPHATLVSLVRQNGISFTGSKLEDVSDEELIAVLFNDVERKNLLDALKP